MSYSPNTINQDPQNDSKCPYIGLIGDVSTHSDYPSDLNYCHRCTPKALPSSSQQQYFCLSDRYSECPLYRNPGLTRMPKELRSPAQSSGTAKKILFAAAIFLITALLLFAWSFRSVFSGFVSLPSPTPTDLFVYMPNANAGIGSLYLVNETESPPTPTATASAQMSTSSGDAPTPRPTATLRSTALITTLLSPTPGCEFLVDYYAVSFYAANKIQLVFNSPIPLDAYLTRNADGSLSQKLELPGFQLRREGSVVYGYGTYLRDSTRPDRLYLEVQAYDDDDIDLEFRIGEARYCAATYKVPKRAKLPKSDSRDLSAPTSIPTAEPSVIPSQVPTEVTVPPATAIPPSPTNTDIPPSRTPEPIPTG